MLISKVIGIGWDVGGWCGKKQGIAVSCWDKQTSKIEWLGMPKTISLPAYPDFTPEYILKNIYDLKNENFDNVCIVVGIDAPLAFPEEFIKIATGRKDEQEFKLNFIKEIDNPLAYRETERYIFNKYGKKPLSASFDKLGNNCTVALAHIKNWRKHHGFMIHPFEGSLWDNKSVIEVYPAIEKSKKDTFEILQNRLPSQLIINSDEYDAAICSLLALSYGAAGCGGLLPELKGPMIPEGIFKSEGWIYHSK